MNAIYQHIYLIIGVLSAIGLMSLIYNLSTYFSTKRNKLLIETEIQRQNQINNANVYIDKVTLTVDVINLCNTLINSNVSHMISAKEMLHEKYDLKFLKEDSEKIATHVYESIRKELIVDNMLVVSDEFILNYISEETILVLLQNATDYNRNLSLMR